MVDHQRVSDLLVAAEAYLDDVRRFAGEIGRGMLDVELAGRLAAMARFRDLLVHQYADLDAVRVWEIVDDDLTDIDLFLGQVAARLGS